MKKAFIYLSIYTLIISTGCGEKEKTSPDSQNVPKRPYAFFSYNITSKSPEAVVEFTNKARYHEEWFWDFGDGFTSTELNPTHTYTKSGNYNVKLIARNGNWSDSLESEVHIEGKYTGCKVKSIKISKVPPYRLGGYRWDPSDESDVWLTLEKDGKVVNTMPSVLYNNVDYPFTWELSPILDVDDLFKPYLLNVYDVDAFEKELMLFYYFEFYEYDPTYPTNINIDYDDFVLDMEVTWY